MPFTVKPFEMPVRVIARMAAFIPGESPPEVNIPIQLILDMFLPVG
jgi:hypothetical protein